MATTLQRSRGGQFVARIATLPGNPYEHSMDRNNLAHASGDAVNAILAGAGYNFSLLLTWLRLLLFRLLILLSEPAQPRAA